MWTHFHYQATRMRLAIEGESMTKLMRVRFKDGRPDEEHVIAGFRNSGMGCRVQAVDGRDLGYFGPEVCESIVLEIRFNHLPIETNAGLDGSCAEARLLEAA